MNAAGARHRALRHRLPQVRPPGRRRSREDERLLHGRVHVRRQRAGAAHQRAHRPTPRGAPLRAPLRRRRSHTLRLHCQARAPPRPAAAASLSPARSATFQFDYNTAPARPHNPPGCTRRRRCSPPRRRCASGTATAPTSATAKSSARPRAHAPRARPRRSARRQRRSPPQIGHLRRCGAAARPAAARPGRAHRGRVWAQRLLRAPPHSHARRRCVVLCSCGATRRRSAAPRRASHWRRRSWRAATARSPFAPCSALTRSAAGARPPQPPPPRSRRPGRLSHPGTRLAVGGWGGTMQARGGVQPEELQD